jgi:hypothetical protein
MPEVTRDLRDGSEIDRLVALLRSDDIEERDAAQHALQARGEDALRSLQPNLGDPDREVAWRTAALMGLALQHHYDEVRQLLGYAEVHERARLFDDMTGDLLRAEGLIAIFRRRTGIEIVPADTLRALLRRAAVLGALKEEAMEAARRVLRERPGGP